MDEHFLPAALANRLAKDHESTHMSWNCRSLDNPRAIQYSCGLVQSHQSNVIFYVRPWFTKKRIEEIRVQLGFEFSFTVDCNGEEGLALF